MLGHKRRPRDDKPTHRKEREVPAQPAQQQRPSTAETFFKKKKKTHLINKTLSFKGSQEIIEEVADTKAVLCV